MATLATSPFPLRSSTLNTDAALRLIHPPRSGPVTASFAEALHTASPHEVAKVTCIDWREGDRGGYLLTSAGAIVHQQMLDDLGLVIRGKRFLVIQGHSDCAKSKAECAARASGETEEAYAERVDRWTKLRLWRNAAKLLENPAVQQELAQGMRFCVAFHDVKSNITHFYERQTREMLRLRDAQQLGDEVSSGRGRSAHTSQLVGAGCGCGDSHLTL